MNSAKRICVVGAGRWGKNHVKTLHDLGSLAGIVDSREETRKWFSQAYPQVETFATLDQALAANFDGFTVATPAETHYEIAAQILNAGKPVLVEKPISLSAAEGEKLEALARKKNLPLMVGHVMLFHPAIVKMKELIGSGKIGKLQYLYSNRLNLGTVRTEENILWSFAPHDISIFQFLVESTPSEVLSRGGAFVQSHIHDSTMTILSYPNNIVGHIFVSWLHPFKEHRLVVIGSKGMLSYDDSSADKSLLFYEKGVDWINGEPVSRDGPTESIPYDKSFPLTEEMKYFLGRVNGDGGKKADGASALQVLRILESASQSLLSNSTVKLGSDVAATSNNSEQEFFVHPSAYLDDGCVVGKGTKIWHFSHIQTGTTIGEKCSIGQNVNVGNNVKIGNFVKIQNNVSVYEGVELEDYVFCGPSMVFTNVNNPRSKYPQRGGSHYLKTPIRYGASIGANATIVCGHSVGRHGFVAAGAVVTKDVPDYAMVAGVPARQIGWMCECGEQLEKFDRSSRIHDAKGAAKVENRMITCPKCNLAYSLSTESGLQPVDNSVSAASLNGASSTSSKAAAN